MRRGRRDGNHKALSELFVRLGFSWADLVDTGVPGLPDGVAGLFQKNHLVEFKDPETSYGRAGLNPNQMAFARDWKGEPVSVVSTQDDVIALVAKWRKSK